MASFSSTVPISGGRGGVLRLSDFSPLHSNEEAASALLASSAAAFSRLEVANALKAFSAHWVDTVGDLRLLQHDDLLRSIGLPPRMAEWVETELSSIVDASTAAASQPSSAEDAFGSAFSFPPLTTSASSSPAAPAALTPLTFRHQSDLDINGVMYWLGTAGLTLPYVNPAQRGLVRVTCSGLMKDSLPIDHVVGRAVVRCVTSAEPAAWICIELCGVWVQPSAYTLRHYISWDTECMRNWVLEGSRDGKLFAPLSVHVNDPAISGIGATHTWTLQLPRPATALTNFFRFFRLTLTGPNNNNHLYLACSGFELYGDLLTAEQYSQAVAAAYQANSALSFPAPAPAAAPPALNGFHPSFPSMEDTEMKSGAVAPSPSPHPAFFPSSVFSSSAASSSHFVHRFDLDQNGLLYAIATERLTQPWRNPAESRRVAVTASSVLEDSAPLSAVVGLDVVRCVTQPRPNSWICLDLLDKTLVLSAYTLRHYASWDIEALRNWRLEGSLTGQEWALLREHENDESLNAKGKACTWTVDHDKAACCRPYRMFRILQTAENSNKHHYLACSGWELYGQLFAADSVSAYQWKTGAASHASQLSASAPAFQPSSGSSVVLSHVSDFDGNGVLHYIATAGLQRPWSNPHTSGALTVTSSSLADDSVGVEALVGRDVVRCVTQNSPGSWIQVDLHDKRLRLSAYTLRHYSSWDTECLRSWRLEGSNGEGDQWELLLEHWNDDALNGKGSTHTWPVTSSAFYSTFRITQTAENSNKHHYLACSGWELYGELRTGPQEANGHQPMELTVDPSKAPQPQPSAHSATPSASSSAFATSSFPTSPRSSPFVSPDTFAAAHGLSVAVNPSRSSAAADIRMSTTGTASALVSPSQSFSPLPFAFASPSPVTSTAPALSYAWEAAERGPFLSISPDAPSVLRNAGSNDKWQMARSLQVFSSGVQRVAVKVLSDPHTSNTWRFIIGVVPTSLDVSGPKQWVGTGGSWGYIAGTGGRCHSQAKSEDYGAKYGEGDVVGLVMDFEQRTLSFWKNGASQGVAYEDLQGPVCVAASLTATDSALALVPFSHGRHEDVDHSAAAQQSLLAAAFGPSQGAAPMAMSQPPLHHSQSLPIGGPSAALASGPMAGSHLASSNRSITLPPTVRPAHLSSEWDLLAKSQYLTVDPADPSVVRNGGSSEKWQCIRSLHAFTRSQSPLHSFSLTVVDAPKTPNSWVMVAGVVPASFTCTGSKQWVGAGGSWGYIAGTGGKCYSEPKSRPYGEVWGKVGDVILVRLDLDAGTVEFVRNGVSQGVAFDGLQAPLYAAVSLTATGSAVKLTIHE